MRTRIIILLISVCISLFSGLRGQELIKGRGRFQLEFDAARFFGDEHQVYTEFYYGIHEASLSYLPTSGGYSGNVHMMFIVKSESAVVAKKEWLVPHAIADTSALTKSQIMTGLESLGLSPGNYTASLSAYDVNDIGRRDSVLLSLPVQLFPSDHESLSDIELCTTIRASAEKKSLFYKNTLEVMPNPSKLFGIGLPVIYYYVEAYNLSAVHAEGRVTVHTSVVDVMGREVVTQNKVKSRVHNASVEIGTVNISSLKGGTFLFRVNLLDSLNTLLASTAKKVFIYRPGAADTSKINISADFASSEYSIMTQEDVDRDYANTQYLRSEAERKQYLALGDLPSRQKFLFEFWQKRKSDNLPTPGEFKAAYIKRIAEANEKYASGLRKGWLGDRGRIYVTYGPPDEVERFPSSSESNPYEIWHFNNLQGGVIFAFVDRNSLGEYTLVHSTHRDELQDENWYQEYAVKMQ